MTDTTHHTRRDAPHWERLLGCGAVAVVAVALLLTAGVAAGNGAQGATEGPRIEATNVTVSGTNVTVTVTAANATEIDLAGVPDDWTVRSHTDDFGTYLNQLDDGDRLVWLWTRSVSPTVSVTFGVPNGTTESSFVLEAVAYDGTTEGGTATLGAATPTPTATATTTPTPTQSTVSGSTETAVEATDEGVESATPTESDAAGETPTQTEELTAEGGETTSGSGPGPGVPTAVIAVVLTALGLWAYS
jgi:hypothetical protein